MQTSASPDLTAGKLIGETAALGDRPAMIVLALPGSDYQLHLVVDGPASADEHGMVTGRVTAQARRVDVTGSGGKFIEPVMGRPRRVQGRIVAVDAGANTITVRSAVTLTAKLMPLQKASSFAPGQFVGFDIERGARFEPTH